MERCPVVRAGQQRGLTAGADHWYSQAILQHDLVADAEAVEESPVLGAAPEEDVLAVVVPPAVVLERPRRYPESRSGFEQGDGCARVDTRERGGQSGQPTTDDGDVRRVHRVHRAAASVARGRAPEPARLCAATHSFSQVGSDIRPSSTASGWASMRPRTRR